MNREEREAVRAADPALFQVIEQILFHADPIGINFETNTDEYESEVATIIPRLERCTSEQDVLVAFTRSFNGGSPRASRAKSRSMQTLPVRSGLRGRVENRRREAKRDHSDMSDNRDDA
jgi:hypothetical protein